MDRQVSREYMARSSNGFIFGALGIGLIAAGVFVVLGRPSVLMAGVFGLCLIGGILCLSGLYMLQPNQGALMTLFGSYRGTDLSEGLRWVNPFYVQKKVSLRARNFNSEKLKVNDLRGNPIEIAAAIVWRVEDTAKASFDVDNFETYVLTQAESAVRHLALSYAYDNLDDAEAPSVARPREITLRSGTDEVAAALRTELQARFAQAGILVVDAKLTHLAYAPEIAGTMLRRQQAEAIVAARSKIVQGAVGMDELALKGLEERGLVQLDDERKAAMVSNLLVVLCSDHDAQPIVNTGTLYN